MTIHVRAGSTTEHCVPSGNVGSRLYKTRPKVKFTNDAYVRVYTVGTRTLCGGEVREEIVE